MLGLAGIAVRSTHYPDGREKYCEKDDTGHEQCASYDVTAVLLWQIGKMVEDHNGAISALSSVVVALFTGTLWWITRRSVTAAEIAANAANTSADIALQHQRPWLFITIEPLEIGFGVDARSIRAIYWFENYGESIASISHYYIDVFISEEVSNGDYGGYRQKYTESYIRPRGQTPRMEVVIPRIIARDEARQVVRKETTIWLDGRMLYQDLSGYTHVSCFRYSYDPEIDVFVNTGPDDNYST